MQQFTEASKTAQPAAGRWRRPGAAWLAAGVAASVLAAGVITVALHQPSPHHQLSALHGQPGHATVRLLDKIANAAAGQPLPTPRPDQFEYIDSQVSFTVSTATGDGSTTKMEPLHRRQIWQSVSDLCRTGLLREYGERTPLTSSPGEKCPDSEYLNAPTYKLLASLPTDPQTLLDMINNAEKGHGPGPAAEAFTPSLTC